SDLGEHDAALAVLDRIPPQTGDRAVRILAARATALEAAGRNAEAVKLLAGIDAETLERVTGNLIPDEDIVVFDTFDEEADIEQTAIEAADGEAE
ncbi:MAG: hypothetical protein FWD83_09405, partial [Promicromonosporaceae bacterium]|nr:hypothetical protein [Promicromonosporaceae bacterium]